MSESPNISSCPAYFYWYSISCRESPQAAWNLVMYKANPEKLHQNAPLPSPFRRQCSFHWKGKKNAKIVNIGSTIQFVHAAVVKSCSKAESAAWAFSQVQETRTMLEHGLFCRKTGVLRLTRRAAAAGACLSLYRLVLSDRTLTGALTSGTSS